MKILVIIIGILICIAYAKFGLKSNDKKQNIYENNEKRQELVEDFEKKAQIDKNDEGKNKENAGGFQGVYLENVKELLKAFSTKDVLEIEQKIITEAKKYNDNVKYCKIEEGSLVKGDKCSVKVYFYYDKEKEEVLKLNIEKVNNDFNIVWNKN